MYCVYILALVSISRVIGVKLAIRSYTETDTILLILVYLLKVLKYINSVHQNDTYGSSCSSDNSYIFFSLVKVFLNWQTLSRKSRTLEKQSFRDLFHWQTPSQKSRTVEKHSFRDHFYWQTLSLKSWTVEKHSFCNLFLSTNTVPEIRDCRKAFIP
jgi:hypothetical protein